MQLPDKSNGSVVTRVVAAIGIIAVVGFSPVADLMASAGEGATTSASPTDLNGIVDGLGSADADAHDAAATRVMNLPDADLGDLAAQLNRPDLPARARQELTEDLATLRKRAGARQRTRATAAAEQKWLTDAALAAYDKVGWKDPRWDADVRRGLTLFFENPAVLHDRLIRGVDVPALPVLQRAIDAGCEDPFVWFAYADSYAFSPHADIPIARERFVRAVRLTEDAPYPPALKAWVIADGVSKAASNGREVGECQRLLGISVGDCAAALRDRSMPPSAAYALCKLFVDAEARFGADRKTALDQFMPMLEAAEPGSSWPLLLKGVEYGAYAADERATAGPDGMMSDDAVAAFHQRLDIADGTLDELCRRAPDDPFATAAMLEVQIAGEADDAVIARWFSRAMAADPDNYDACIDRLNSLSPAAHGSAEQMLAFGRACVAGRNFQARIPFVLVEAHERLAHDAGPGAASGNYFHQPAVWDDLRSVYGPYLMLYPESLYDRGEYVRFAALCGAWDVAANQLDLIGTADGPKAFGGRDRYEHVCRQVEDHRKRDTPATPAAPT